MPVQAKLPEARSISHYDLIEKIAEGGMGTVFKGRDRRTGQTVAVKVVPPHLLSNKVFLKRFEQEYSAAKQLNHPNIVRALDFGNDGETPYLVMEFVDGESLGSRLDREQRLPEAEAIQIMVQVAQGLQMAHGSGLIHRDVKPDNILLTRDGVAKLTDLGLVKEREADLNLTRTGRGLGTPHFMAPEQFRNAKNADARCDIYSMAATLYMLVTGELPFKSCSPLDAWMKKLNNDLPAPRKINPNLSERLEAAIRRSMHQDPNQRAASCREFIEDLTGVSTARKEGRRETPLPTSEIWYMIYRDEDDVVHTVKGSTESIRQSLRDGLLGDAANIRVSRAKTGPFEVLHSQTQFRDLVSGNPMTPIPKDEADQPRSLGGASHHGANSRSPGESTHGRRSPRAPADSVHSGSVNTPVTMHSGSRRSSLSQSVGAGAGTGAGTVPPPPDFRGASPANIQIPMDIDDEPADWTKLLVYLLLGIGLGAAAFILVPKFMHVRWF